MATLKVRVTPAAREDRLAGWYGDALRVRVTAQPVKGLANKAVIGLLAARLGIAPARLAIRSGARSRDKVILVDGLSDKELRSRLNDSDP